MQDPNDFFRDLVAFRQENEHQDQTAFQRKAFFLAVKHNRIEIVKLFLAIGISKIDDKDDHHHPRTPLIVAAVEGHHEMAMFLLDAGAGVDDTDDEGGTALHHAVCGEGYLEISKLLLDRGANVNAIDNDKITPLHDHCRSDYAFFNLELTDLLLSHNANIMALNEDLWTPVHHLVDMHEVDIVKYILHAEDQNLVTAALLSANKDGQIPFHCVHTKCMASFLITSAVDVPPGKKLSPVCREMLIARDNEKKTLLDRSKDMFAEYPTEHYKALILYLESYTEQSLLVRSPQTAMEVDGSGPMEIPLNQVYDDFQRSIVKVFLKSAIGIPKWLIPSKDENGATVFETPLPRDLKYVILSFLSLADIMLV